MKSKLVYYFDPKLVPSCRLSGLEIEKVTDYIRVTVNENKLPKECKATYIHSALRELQINPKKTDLIRALGVYLQHRRSPFDISLFSKIGFYFGLVTGCVGLLYFSVSLEIIIATNLDIGIVGAIGMALGLVVGVWLCMFLSAYMGQVLGLLIGKCLNINCINRKHEIQLRALLMHSIKSNTESYSSTINSPKVEEYTQLFLYNIIDEKLSKKDKKIILEDKLFIA